VLLIGIINNGLSVMGVATHWQYIVQGLLLIVALFSAGVLTCGGASGMPLLAGAAGG